MKEFMAAMSFLTILPVSSSEVGERELSDSVKYFPFAGMVIGLLAVAVGWVVSHLLPELPTAVVMVLLLAGISRCLHLDGLADTADGFLSSRPKERIMEIMRDSRIGSMGVFAIVGVMFLKASLIFSLPPESLLPGLFLMPVFGRCAIVINLAFANYAREDGLAAAFFRDREIADAVLAAAAAGLAAAAALFAGGEGIISLLFAGFFSALAISVITFCWIKYCDHKIGGSTGDTLGALCEIGELLPILILAAL